MTYAVYLSLLTLAGLPHYEWSVYWGEAYADLMRGKTLAMIKLVRTVLDFCPRGTLQSIIEP